MRMRKIDNPELTAPAHLIGEDAEGNSIYQWVDGWELDLEGGEEECVYRDSDGRYVISATY